MHNMWYSASVIRAIRQRCEKYATCNIHQPDWHTPTDLCCMLNGIPGLKF